MSDHGEDRPRFGKYILAAVLFYIALFGFYLRFAPSEDSGGVSSVSTKPEPLGQTDLSPMKPSDSGISAARETTSPSKAKPSYSPHYSTSNYSYPYPDMEFDGYDDPDDFAADWADAYGDDYEDEEEAMEDAYDMWEEAHEN